MVLAGRDKEHNRVQTNIKQHESGSVDCELFRFGSTIVMYIALIHHFTLYHGFCKGFYGIRKRMLVDFVLCVQEEVLAPTYWIPSVSHLGIQSFRNNFSNSDKMIFCAVLHASFPLQTIDNFWYLIRQKNDSVLLMVQKQGFNPNRPNMILKAKITRFNFI